MPTETSIDNDSFMKEINVKPIHIPNKIQEKTCIELSFTGAPYSTVGLNIIEYDVVLQGLSNEISKERLLKYLTIYEQVPNIYMPIKQSVPQSTKNQNEFKLEKDKKEQIDLQRKDYQVRYSFENMFIDFGPLYPLPLVEGDDIYVTSNMGRFYDIDSSSASMFFNSKQQKKSMDEHSPQYDIGS